MQIRPGDPLATSLCRLGKDRRNLREEGIDLKRLGDDGDAAGSVRTRKVILRDVGGEGDHGDVPGRGVRFEASSRFPAIQQGQREIH